MKQQVSSLNNPRIINGKQNMLCEVSVNEIYCFAGHLNFLECSFSSVLFQKNGI